MTEYEAELMVASALSGLAAVPGTCSRCEPLRQQLVSFLFAVPVEFHEGLDQPDPECLLCALSHRALSQSLTPQALDCLEAEVQAQNPLACALWRCLANPRGIL